jgi:ubiquinone/menaquinone biosynthesis C-methylase UbiE
VLEAACGPGLGVHYLAKHARFIVGGDYTQSLVETARRSPQTVLSFIRMDAQALPFRQESFDVVVCYEALYYFPEPDCFLMECRRVLGSHGLLLLCSVNPEWPDFNPSPRSCRYHTANGLARLLEAQGFSAIVYGAFPVRKDSTRDHVVSWIKRLAVALHLIPSTMQGKQFLKRLFLGKLAPIPSALTEGLASYQPPVPVEAGAAVHDFKILFTVARPN